MQSMVYFKIDKLFKLINKNSIDSQSYSRLSITLKW